MEECVGCLKIHSGRAAMRVLGPAAEPELPRGRALRERERQRARESAGKERSGWKEDGGRSC